MDFQKHKAKLAKLLRRFSPQKIFKTGGFYYETYIKLINQFLL